MQLYPALLCELGLLICLTLASDSYCGPSTAKTEVVKELTSGAQLKRNSAWSWLSDIVGVPKEKGEGHNGGIGLGNNVRFSSQIGVVQESLRWEMKSNWCDATGLGALSHGGSEGEKQGMEVWPSFSEAGGNGDVKDGATRVMERLEAQSSENRERALKLESQEVSERRFLREEDGDVERIEGRRESLEEEWSDSAVDGNPPDSSEELEGDFYYNLDIFKRTYADMEKRMQIFVYRDGKAPLAHYYDTTDHYAIDGIFQRFLDYRVTPLVAEDASSANMFFVPINFAGTARFLFERSRVPGRPNLKSQKAYIGAFVDLLEQNYPYLKAKGGKDHFMLSCHEWAPLLSRSHRTLHMRMMRGLCNNNVSYDFAWTRDVAIPEINMPRQQPITRFGGPPVSERSILAFFAGHAEGKVRERLIEVWANRREGMRVFKGDIPPSDPFTFKDYLHRSKFCLCPGAMQVNTARIVEAIYNDCVPVVLSDGVVLPFSDVLDWAKFAVIVYIKQIPKLRDILTTVVEDGKYREMHSRLALVRKHLIFNETPRKFDAFYMILHSFWLRQLQARDEVGPIFKEL